MRHYLFGGRDIAISQRFGENPGAYARFTVSAPGGGTQPMHGHNGDDFAAWQGTVLYALEDGVVLEASNDLYGYGLTVYLLADSGRGWRYGHFQALDVNQGQRVRKGDRLGLSGNSGNSTGPHLHLGLRPPDPEHTNGYGGYVDPYPTLMALQAEDDAPEEDSMQGIIDELNGQVAALRAEIEAINGVNTELGKQVNSLSWLLRTSQDETQVQAAEVARLQALAAAAPTAPAPRVSGVDVKYEDGRTETFFR